MLKKSLVILLATTFMTVTYSASAEDAKVDTENVQPKQNEQRSHHSHSKDAKGVPQAEKKEVKDTENKEDTKKHLHPRDGK